jgi:Fe-S-cluster containining protein
LKAENGGSLCWGHSVVDTFYLHLGFEGKSKWSINLPFFCTKCGNCCKIEDFLSAGKINANPEEHPEAHAKLRTLFEELGELWKTNEAKYDEHIMNEYCPFLLENKSCSIYEIRPDGCRLFPKTAFGMESQDCEPLTRFGKMRAALKKGRTTKEKYYFIGKPLPYAKSARAIRPARFTEKQYQNCIVKLRKAGMTDNELILFNRFNGQDESRVHPCS